MGRRQAGLEGLSAGSSHVWQRDRQPAAPLLPKHSPGLALLPKESPVEGKVPDWVMGKINITDYMIESLAVILKGS